MWRWLTERSAALQALGSILTAMVAVAALAGVIYQVETSREVQREASAKDAYRNFLDASFQNPQFATPDICALRAQKLEGRYQAFVTYFLFAAEQVIDIDSEWRTSVRDELALHLDFVCTSGAREDGAWSPALAGILDEVRAEACAGYVAPVCPTP